jgi:hypothetical protein
MKQKDYEMKNQIKLELLIVLSGIMKMGKSKN